MAYEITHERREWYEGGDRYYVEDATDENAPRLGLFPNRELAELFVDALVRRDAERVDDRS
jgi:hypothetical protein